MFENVVRVPFRLSKSIYEAHRAGNLTVHEIAEACGAEEYVIEVMIRHERRRRIRRKYKIDCFDKDPA